MFHGGGSDCFRAVFTKAILTSRWATLHMGIQIIKLCITVIIIQDIHYRPIHIIQTPQTTQGVVLENCSIA